MNSVTIFKIYRKKIDHDLDKWKWCQTTYDHGLVAASGDRLILSIRDKWSRVFDFVQ